MRAKKTLMFVLLGVFLAASWMVASAQEAAKAESKEAAKATYTYKGVKNCKMCHSNPKTGSQYGVWEKTPHANAYASLATDEAKAKAKELGIDDPQKSDKCLKCHVTAYPVMKDLANEKITLEEGVSCESCHGPGSGYSSIKVMKATYEGTMKPESVGLNAKPDEKTCLHCHVPEGNPFYKEFKFADFYKKIAHPIPKAGG
jgi:hypothetical protein